MRVAVGDLLVCIEARRELVEAFGGAVQRRLNLGFPMEIVDYFAEGLGSLEAAVVQLEDGLLICLDNRFDWRGTFIDRVVPLTLRSRLVVQACSLALAHLDGRALVFSTHSLAERQVKSRKILRLAQSNKHRLLRFVAQLLLLYSIDILFLLIDCKLMVERSQRLLLLLSLVVFVVVIGVEILL